VTTSAVPATTSPASATTSSASARPLMRRRDAIAAAAVAVLAGPAAARAQRSDVAVLIRLLEREEAAAEVYGSGKGVVVATYQDESDHAAALRTHLDALGRRPAERGLDAPARRLAEASGDDRFAAAIALEASLVEDYGAALADIADPSVLQTVATILASHAQHLARMRAGAAR
jgi:Ferritin-like domain